jgi:hypothetical protein
MLLSFAGNRATCNTCVNGGHLLEVDRREDRRLRDAYGISLEDYQRMAGEQGGLCAICKQPERLVVDHDHRTGKVRGLLCAKCNSGIGMLGDSGDVARNAADYLDANGGARLPPANPVAVGQRALVARLEHERSVLEDRCRESERDAKEARARAQYLGKFRAHTDSIRAWLTAFRRVLTGGAMPPRPQTAAYDLDRILTELGV